MTYALHLDSEFTPYASLERISFEAFTFSGGEPHLKLANASLDGTDVIITQRAKSWNDLGLVATAVDAVRRAGAGSVSLLLPYFPGARQDRVMVPGEPLTVKVYADFINSLSLKRVTIYDPHSSVAPALLDRVEVIDNLGFAKAVLDALPADTVLIAPDAGAQKKVYHVAAALGGRHVVDCGKRRDVKTGALSGFAVYAYDREIAGKPCLILDDICDGGGTFIGLAKALRQYSPGNLYLAVSHGIFSKGVDSLAEVFTKVYTTDAFSTPPVHDGLEVVGLDRLFHFIPAKSRHNS